MGLSPAERNEVLLNLRTTRSIAERLVKLEGVIYDLPDVRKNREKREREEEREKLRLEAIERKEAERLEEIVIEQAADEAEAEFEAIKEKMRIARIAAGREKPVKIEE